MTAVKVLTSPSVPLLLAAAAVVVWLVLYLCFGREHREADAPTYVREPPTDRPPTEVTMLLGWGELDARALTATVMDLVRRGALRLLVAPERGTSGNSLVRAPQENGYVIERVRGFSGPLRQSELYLIDDILFGGVDGDRVELGELEGRTRGDTRAAMKRFSRWVQLAKKESKQFRVVEPWSYVAFQLCVVLGLLMAAYSAERGVLSQSPAFALSGAAGLALAVAGPSVMRRTAEAAHELHQWQAFRSYLNDFSRLRESQPPAVAIWEKYLVYAVTFGVARGVLSELEGLSPELPEKDSLGSSLWHWATSGDRRSLIEAADRALFCLPTPVSAAKSPSTPDQSDHGGGSEGGGGMG